MSIKNSVPVIGLIYDQKVRNIMNMCGMSDYAIDLDGINADGLSKTLFALWDNRIQIRLLLKNQSRKMACYAEKNIENLKNILFRDYAMPSQRYSKEIVDFLFNYISQNITGTTFQATSLIDKIRYAVNQKDYQKSISLCKENIAFLSKERAETLYLLAFSLHCIGERENALTYYAYALAEAFSEFWVVIT
jgi:tetratricopeptide (TPR) repeat protein